MWSQVGRRTSIDEGAHKRMLLSHRQEKMHLGPSEVLRQGGSAEIWPEHGFPAIALLMSELNNFVAGYPGHCGVFSSIPGLSAHQY